MGRLRKSKKKPARSKAARRAEREEQESKTYTIKPTWRKGLFQCFICMDTDIDLHSYELFQHEELDIAMCDSCANAHYNEKYEWHADEICNSYDDNGKCMYCTICGEGGTLMACDVSGCQKSYCLECLEKWMGKETLDKYVDSSIQFFCCYSCFNNNNKAERDLEEGQSHQEEDAKQLSMLINQQMLDSLTKNVYKIYGNLLRASKSYLSQKDKIDMEDIYIKLDQKLSCSGSTKECVCYCCFEFVTFTKKSLPQMHPRFQNVITCDDCIEFLDLPGAKAGKFNPVDFCWIKGEGGDLITCDSCDKNYCLEILEKWYGYKEIHKIIDNNDNFCCFLCDEDVGRYKEFVRQSEKVRNAFVKSFMEDEDFEEMIPEHQKRLMTVTANRKKKTIEKAKPAGERQSSRIKRKLKVTKGRAGSRRRGERSRGYYSDEQSSDTGDSGIISKPKTRKKNTNSIYITRGESEFESEDDEENVRDRKRQRMMAKRNATESESRQYFEKLFDRVPKRYRSSKIFQELYEKI